MQAVQNTGTHQATFCFLSRILGSRIYGEDGRFIGRIRDVVATARPAYPELDAVVVARGHHRLRVRLAGVEWLTLARTGRAVVGGTLVAHAPVQGNQFLVRDTLYDKQVVDVNGAKVERVNDVHFLVHGDRSFLVHVDVGLTGLSRRLGFERGLRTIARTFRLKLHDDFIGWKYVQPLPETYPSPVQITLRQEQIRSLHAGELADIIEELARDDRIHLVRSMDAESAADALEETDLAVQTAIIRDLDSETAADIVEEMDPAAASDLMESLPDETRKTIMDAMESDERIQVETLSRAQDETAAQLMTLEFLASPDTRTAQDALDLVRRNAEETDFIYYVYCLDGRGRLSGVVSLRDLLLASPNAALSTFMNRRLATLMETDDWGDVAEAMMKYRFRALPVVDETRRMRGVVTFRHSFEELLPLYHRLAA